MTPVRLLLPSLLLLAACDEEQTRTFDVADGIFGKLGDPLPSATPEQLATFERGHAVAERRFTRATGLGPGFNVTFCASCHERPVIGGGAGLYRNFFIGGNRDEFGNYFPLEGDPYGARDGVVRLYYHDPLEAAEQAAKDTPDVGCDTESARPIDSARPSFYGNPSVMAQRNPIPFFGVGLMAEIDEAEILLHADPDDADGDGISGRPNEEEGFVGRFGMKAQTVSIEGFIRGPLMNHAGITTDPLSQAQKAALPVDSSNPDASAWNRMAEALGMVAQSAAPAGPLRDDDCIPDPELSTNDLFDLVSFAMLLAAPEPEPLTDTSARGQELFGEIGCASCHVPMLYSAKREGGIPLYSDLLVHDMGPELADGINMKLAGGQEFRTQPLWGVSPVGPFLHDGRAITLDEAIRWHGGEAKDSRDRYADLEASERDAVVAFLESLGGRDQYTPGLVAPDTPVAPAGEWGGPSSALDAAGAERFLAGRTLFDTEFGISDGVGGPRFNGDSCRACHFEPVVGGAGPRGVNVVRHGIDKEGAFVQPTLGTILHRSTSLPGTPNPPQTDANVFELRQTPHLFGLGLIEGIDEATILERADPEDTDQDGISGKPSYVDGGKLGRFGWKAQIPNVHEFVRDAVSAELGMTMEYEPGLTFGKVQDNDGVPDPEFSLEDVALLTFYLSNLAPPPRGPTDNVVNTGEQVFAQVGCDKCHVPSLEGANGPVPLYSDLLLHEILPSDTRGIEEASATEREFRTPPLWGVRDTAPYMHNGAADTLLEAILLHDGEASFVRDAFDGLSEENRAALLAFVGSL